MTHPSGRAGLSRRNFAYIAGLGLGGAMGAATANAPVARGQGGLTGSAIPSGEPGAGASAPADAEEAPSLDSQVAALLIDRGSDSYSSIARAHGMSVREFGAVGDGVADDTGAFQAAVIEADGSTLRVPEGRYMLSGMTIPEGVSAHLDMDANAVLVHAPQPRNWSAIILEGDRLSITGGMLDGNWRAHDSRDRHVIRGTVGSGKFIGLYRVRVFRTLMSCVDVDDFGGTVEIIDCEFREQAEHSGVMGQHTMIARVGNGNDGERGLVRFNGNRCYGTTSPAIPGGSPGGIFLASNGFVPGGPGSEGFSVGNNSAVEAVGNYFFGYGQHPPGQNDISPIHTYPAWAGVRVIGNHFEGCSYSAISVKCSESAVISNNVIQHGQISAGNTNSEGAIDAVLGYQGGVAPRTHCVISGNIVRDPGGQSDAERQIGIQVRGLKDAPVGLVSIVGNVVSQGGPAVRLMNCFDATIGSNVLQGGDSSISGWDRGVQIVQCFGSISVMDNQITVTNAEAILAAVGCAEADIEIDGNSIRSAANGRYAVNLKGVRSGKLANNVIDVSARIGRAIYVGPSGEVSTKRLIFGAGNTIFGGTKLFVWDRIDVALGSLIGNGDPNGVVSSPMGANYVDESASNGAPVFWVRSDAADTTKWSAIAL